MFAVGIRMETSSKLDHPVGQGDVWLAASAGGANTTANSYAAFEFPFVSGDVSDRDVQSLIERVGAYAP